MEGVEVPESILVPAEARRFVPDRSIVVQGEGKKLERFIFYNQPLEPIEERAIAELDALVRQKGLENYRFPPNWSRDDLLRCIYGTKWKADKARKVLLNHLKWLASLPADYRLLFDSIARILNYGVLYVHGRDCFYRPLLVLRLSRLDLNVFTIDEFMNATIFLLEYVKDNMLLPGVIENWVSIADLEDVSLTALPISTIKGAVRVLAENYRCRLGVSYVLNSPRSVSIGWALIKPFLDKQTIKKVSFHRESTCQQMFTHFAHSQIETKYGGSAPDVTNYWPPTVPPPPFS